MCSPGRWLSDDSIASSEGQQVYAKSGGCHVHNRQFMMMGQGVTILSVSHLKTKKK